MYSSLLHFSYGMLKRSFPCSLKTSNTWFCFVSVALLHLWIAHDCSCNRTVWDVTFHTRSTTWCNSCMWFMKHCLFLWVQEQALEKLRGSEKGQPTKHSFQITTDQHSMVARAALCALHGRIPEAQAWRSREKCKHGARGYQASRIWHHLDAYIELAYTPISLTGHLVLTA